MRLFVLTGVVFLFTTFSGFSQILPKGMTEKEKAMMSSYVFPKGKGITSPPTWQPRAMGEWEEIDALLITWTSYHSVLAQIVDAAQEECTVLIACSDSNSVKSSLSGYGVPLTNLDFIEVPYNSVWIRDYGAHTIYKNEVDSHALVDWTYNRPRPYDDAMPALHASWAGLDMYEMTTAPWDFVATGGNLMVDGFGTAMSSQLIVNENPSHSIAEIDTIMKRFLGIDTYVLFPTLPYDGIHHIDMHMKFLDEETILLGEYPSGISDGPQIEANLAWMQSNYMSMYGTPYRIIRIPMLPNLSGTMWPSNGAYYRTYTNGVFVNNTYIYPSYYEKYDTTAYRIYQEVLPGYNLVPIDCDPDPISASGAIHCITNCIGISNPLLISHQRLNDQTTPGNYQVDAYITHSSCISSATIYYKTTMAGSYQSVTMSNTGGNDWTGYIPQQSSGDSVYYYIHAQAVSGKQQTRPMPAPDGYWAFRVNYSAGIADEIIPATMMDVYPNPAAYLTCIPVQSSSDFTGSLQLLDASGRLVQVLYEGKFPAGESNYFFNALGLESGLYLIMLQTEEDVQVQKVVVRNF